MAAHKIGCLPIIENGKLAGIVTLTELLRAHARQDVDLLIDAGGIAFLSAQELMTKNPLTTSPTAKLADAVEVMTRARIRHLPVVDEENKMIGLLSHGDRRVHMMLSRQPVAWPEMQV